jgi:hypothetical protein
LSAIVRQCDWRAYNDAELHRMIASVRSACAYAVSR